jgi:hypothetical protein
MQSIISVCIFALAMPASNFTKRGFHERNIAITAVDTSVFRHADKPLGLRHRPLSGAFAKSMHLRRF